MQAALEDIQKKARPVFEKYGIRRASVFGSHARGDAKPDSDVDLLIKLGDRPMGMIAYVRFLDELEGILGREVDVITEGNINRHLRPYIESDVTPIYEG